MLVLRGRRRNLDICRILWEGRGPEWTHGQHGAVDLGEALDDRIRRFTVLSGHGSCDFLRLDAPENGRLSGKAEGEGSLLCRRRSWGAWRKREPAPVRKGHLLSGIAADGLVRDGLRERCIRERDSDGCTLQVHVHRVILADRIVDWRVGREGRSRKDDVSGWELRCYGSGECCIESSFALLVLRVTRRLRDARSRTGEASCERLRGLCRYLRKGIRALEARNGKGGRADVVLISAGICVYGRLDATWRAY